jgi:putative FmdB family regulatory protein
MALYEFLCESCKTQFEEIRSSHSQEALVCPACNGTGVRKLISRFAVGGQGDLRESTLHGCHEYTGGPDHDHGPAHAHDED